jgi:uncharacterized repeat protein (TIGR03943 family)
MKPFFTQRRIDFLILGGYGVYLVYAYFTNILQFYIHPSYFTLTLWAGIFLIGVAILGLTWVHPGKADEFDFLQHEELENSPRSGVAYLLILLPLAIGFLLPPQPLSLATANQRGVDFNNLTLSRDEGKTIHFYRNTEELTIKDWIKLFNTDPEPQHHVGKKAKVVGFVFRRDDNLPKDSFLLSRFVVTCCAVDARPVGLLVRYEAHPELEEGSWVEVQGIWEVGELAGKRTNFIRPTQVVKTQRPAQPYLY